MKVTIHQLLWETRTKFGAKLVKLQKWLGCLRWRIGLSRTYLSLICYCFVFRKKSWGDEDKVSGKITASTKSMCSAVAKLTQWADRVITDGCVDPTEDYVNQVIEPVRLAVNSLASNLLAISIVPKSTSFHNSLPDLGEFRTFFKRKFF